jgi:hypothetical protein
MTGTAAWKPTIRVGMPLPSGRLMDLGLASGLPMLVSANAFSRVKQGEFEGFNLRAAAAIPASSDVALDSAGFVACAKYGGYRWSTDQYLDLVAARQWSFWSACDYCVEPEVAADAATRRLRIEATVSGYFDCLRRAQARGLSKPMPVCQGRYPDEYVRCIEQLAISPATALLGVGSVCGVHLISVQKVTVRASPQSEDWRGVCSRGERKCLSRFEFLLVS